MAFVYGLNLDIDSVNRILEIAQDKGYFPNEKNITACYKFRFDAINQIFEFHLKNEINIINLDMDKFIECYTIFLKM